MTCWWASHSGRNPLPADSCNYLAMASEQSRAEGGQELMVDTAGNFWSFLFHLSALASLKAVWNLVFILFWQRQQHLQLFQCPLLQLHLNVSWHKTWSMSLAWCSRCRIPPVPLPRLQQPVQQGRALIQPSCITLTHTAEKKPWEGLWRDKKGKIRERLGRAVETGLLVAQGFRKESSNVESYKI